MTYMPLGPRVLNAIRAIYQANLLPMSKVPADVGQLLQNYNLAQSTGHALYLTDEGLAAATEGWAVINPQPSVEDSRKLRQEVSSE